MPPAPRGASVGSLRSVRHPVPGLAVMLRAWTGSPQCSQVSRSVVVMIAGWGDKHTAGAQGPPVERVHRRCGRVATLRLTCEHCGEPVTARDMQARPGPAYRTEDGR